MNKKLMMTVLSATFIATSVVASNADVVKTDRVGGSDRYGTSVEISRKTFSKSDKAIIASGEDFADALTGGQVAMAENAPLLLTGSKSMNKSVLEEMKRLNVKDVIIIGGEKSISKDIENNLQSNYKVLRLSDKNRELTSLKIAEYLEKKDGIKSIGIVNGYNFSDALAATPYMNMKKGAIILSRKENIEPEVGKFVAKHKAYVFGGEQSISEKIRNIYKADRISGKDRYETAEAIKNLYVKENENKKINNILLADGNNFADALSSVSLSGKLNAPILFNNESTIGRLKNMKDVEVVIIGGEKSIGKNIEQELKNKNTDKNVISNTSGKRKHSGSSSSYNSKYVNIPDKLFLKVVNKNIDPNRADDQPVTKEDMLKLKQLSVYGPNTVDITNVAQGTKRKEIIPMHKIDTKWMVSRGLKSIEGIQFAKNLEAIEISECEIKDITPLKELKNLKYLEIDRNRITDVSPLSELTNLEHLKLYNNLITDISPLKNLTNLNYLDVHFNTDNDGKAGISNVDSLKNLKKLEILDLSANHITNVDVLTELPKLRIVDFSGNNVDNYEKLADVINPLVQASMNGDSDRSCGFFGQNRNVNLNIEVPGEGGTVVVKSPFKGLNELANTMFEANTFFLENSGKILQSGRFEVGKSNTEIENSKIVDEYIESINYDAEKDEFVITIKPNKTGESRTQNLGILTGAESYQWIISGITVTQKPMVEEKNASTENIGEANSTENSSQENAAKDNNKAEVENQSVQK